MLGGETVENLDGGVNVERAGDVHRQGFTGELVSDVAQLQLAPVAGGVELAIDSPQRLR